MELKIKLVKFKDKKSLKSEFLLCCLYFYLNSFEYLSHFVFYNIFIINSYLDKNELIAKTWKMASGNNITIPEIFFALRIHCGDFGAPK